jgi:hypothetical protein
VLAAADGARSLMEFLTTTTESLDEHLGFQQSAFMLTLADQGRAYAGVKHGGPEYVMEEYFERWADRDALGSEAARRSFATHGWSTISGIYAALDAPHRRFVDDFLRRTRLTGQLSIRMPGRFTDAYLTLMGSDDFASGDRAFLQGLVPGLDELLRRWLPTGLEPNDALSPRERDVRAHRARIHEQGDRRDPSPRGGHGEEARLANAVPAWATEQDGARRRLGDRPPPRRHRRQRRPGGQWCGGRFRGSTLNLACTARPRWPSTD